MLLTKKSNNIIFHLRMSWTIAYLGSDGIFNANHTDTSQVGDYPVLCVPLWLASECLSIRRSAASTWYISKQFNSNVHVAALVLHKAYEMRQAIFLFILFYLLTNYCGIHVKREVNK